MVRVYRNKLIWNSSSLIYPEPRLGNWRKSCAKRRRKENKEKQTMSNLLFVGEKKMENMTCSSQLSSYIYFFLFSEIIISKHFLNIFGLDNKIKFLHIFDIFYKLNLKLPNTNSKKLSIIFKYHPSFPI